VLLVGDAAGYVDALTGEGLAIGFLSAQAAVAATVTGDLEQYAAEWRRITRRFRWSTELLLRATTAQAPRSVLLPLAASWPSLFGRAVRVMT
jgi:flavin-dependent dehydrogenase